jgi:hypothetical protein
MRQTIISLVIFLSLAIVGCCNMHAESLHKQPGFIYPTVAEIGSADTDILGEAALRQPGGPSYEFLRDALPPLRYVDANFHVYPITLSAPANLTKARFVSDGSAINALARQPDWNNETGTPVTFYVGDRRELFGGDPTRLSGPKYADGYLPIVQVVYTSQGSMFAEEAFCSTNAKLADNAVVFVKFTLLKSDGPTHGGLAKLPDEPAARVPVPGVESVANKALYAKVYNAKIEASVEGYTVNHLENGQLVNADGKILAAVYPQWAFNPGRGALIAPLKVGKSAYLAICTKPTDVGVISNLTPEIYQQQRDACAKTWNDFLNSGTVVHTPEPLVDNVWRSLLIGDQELRSGDQVHYSAGNAYSKMYIGEGGDTVVATALWGHDDDARHEIIPQFKYTRKGLEFHQAALKLQMLATYYRLTRDEKYVRSIRPLWEKELNVILNGRQKSTGMLPREKYCGDIATMVYSLNSNSNCWRALRDMSSLLDDLGEHDRAQQISQAAAEYRKIILAAIEQATRHDVNPPFVPIALSGEESPHDPIWGTTMGSYWNLMIEYVLGSSVFTADSRTATDIVNYLQQKGGLTMGLLRARADELNFYMDGPRINDLYGMRYALLMDQRDEPNRALLSFYGKLAQGMTRDTFVDCEGSSLVPVDCFGRQMYLPPNSAGNASFLQQLRYLLIQDYDTNDDGQPDTLRLLFATPRAWLADGKSIVVSNAPTAFGTMSMIVRSQLQHGEISAEVDLPDRVPQQIYLRLRLPEGHKLLAASAGGRDLKINGETIELAGASGHVNIEVKVK